jgi:hypothetical protein
VREHISFSEFKLWSECTWRHKLKYIEGLDGFTGNAFTAFGSAIHSACEEIAVKNLEGIEEKFEKFFDNEIEELEEVTDRDRKLLTEMRDQGKNILPHVLVELEKQFPNFELVAVEEDLFEEFEEGGLKFKGYIDLVLKSEDGKYHIIDWKSCSWGWDARKKADKILGYQLVFYKWFWARKHDVPLENIETHFGLLKRTAKKNNVEIFRVTSGQKKVDNALTALKNAVINIKRQRFIKNRLSCKYCPFYRTEHCR